MTFKLDDANQYRIDLKLPLLILGASKGLLACGYLNVDTFNKTSEAAAIVTGVKNYEDMLAASVVAVSDEASRLGVSLGDSGQDALDKMSD